MTERPSLDELKVVWLVPAVERIADGRAVAAADEDFHATLVAATGNDEMARIHRELTERIRIIRRLDFTKDQRVETTYQEHAKILRAIVQRRADAATLLLRTHIEASKAEVRKITLHMLHEARERADEAAVAAALAARGVVLVGVSVDEKAAAYAAFVKKMTPPFLTLHDVTQKLVRTVAVPAMPTTYLIGRDGKVRFIHAGYQGESTDKILRTQIDKLLAAK
jgi:hypothetical protein